ncbi:MAG: helix-hairpin-helix domain-containing protein [Ardenticatenales bacterium]|nr:helix-hairpin-helix domain-containing protein [Ardenticatenales bacterium]
MDTLRRFAAAALPPPGEGFAPYFSKPDQLLDSFELRRLKVPKRKGGLPETDLFEYYWAHHMSGNSLGHVLPLLRTFMLRRPSRVPPSLRAFYVLLWLIALLALVVGTVVAFGAPAFAWLAQIRSSSSWPVRIAAGIVALLASLPVVSTVGLIVLWLVRRVGGSAVRNTFVDVARYLNPAPVNIEVRQKIRAGAVELLDRLHRQGKYDRIIVVGHSLGSIIGMDAIYYLWSNVHKQRHNLKMSRPAALARLERRAGALRSAVKLAPPNEAAIAMARERFREAQSALWIEIIQGGCPWRISDFVTLGSPLTHAAVFMAENLDELRARRMDRDVPSCPPESEPVWKGGEPVGETEESERYSASYLYSGGRGDPAVPPRRLLPHAAAFAPTRWTNIWFPSKGYVLKVFGDWFGGPLAPYFGPGIEDRPVTAGPWGRWWPVVPHTHYFDAFAGDGVGEIEAVAGVEGSALYWLRQALRLSDHAIVEGAAEAARWRVNLNEADVAELQMLPGIGAVRAASVVAHRAGRAGGFGSVADLACVVGMSPEVVEQIVWSGLATVGTRPKAPARRAAGGA